MALFGSIGIWFTLRCSLKHLHVYCFSSKISTYIYNEWVKKTNYWQLLLKLSQLNYWHHSFMSQTLIKYPECKIIVIIMFLYESYLTHLFDPLSSTVKCTQFYKNKYTAESSFMTWGDGCLLIKLFVLNPSWLKMFVYIWPYLVTSHSGIPIYELLAINNTTLILMGPARFL